MQRSSYPYITLIAWILAVFFLTSCGANRKVLSIAGASERNTTTRKSIPTDASDARVKSWSASGIDNYAAILGVSARDLKNKSLYSFIDKWLGSPHRLAGTNPSGMDCSGFVGVLYREVYGKDLPR